MLQWGLARGQPRPPSLGTELYGSGVTFFTLGYGNVVPGTGVGWLTAVADAGSGFGPLATIIGYLSVLYQLYARREGGVIGIDPRAGSPPAAGTLLSRYAGGERLDAL